tara:strand:+ start:304 stop:459 length:156 start_codon:yes stop_codon:yes gene_type:complete
MAQRVHESMTLSKLQQIRLGLSLVNNHGMRVNLQPSTTRLKHWLMERLAVQ